MHWKSQLSIQLQWDAQRAWCRWSNCCQSWTLAWEQNIFWDRRHSSKIWGYTPSHSNDFFHRGSSMMKTKQLFFGDPAFMETLKPPIFHIKIDVFCSQMMHSKIWFALSKPCINDMRQQPTVHHSGERRIGKAHWGGAWLGVPSVRLTG